MSTLKRLSISNPNNIQFKYAYMGDGPYDFSGLPFRKAYWKKIFIRSPHLMFFTAATIQATRLITPIFQK
jgi:hypothetical protein